MTTYGAFDLKRFEMDLIENANALADARVEGLSLVDMPLHSVKASLFSCCDGRHISLEKVEWTHTTVNDTLWLEARFTASLWIQVHFAACDFRNAHFEKLVLSGVQLESSELSYTQWNHCLFTQNTIFSPNTSLSHAVFENTVFDGVSFLDIPELTFETMEFRNCTFLRSNLRQSQIERLRGQNIISSTPILSTPELTTEPLKGSPVPVTNKTTSSPPPLPTPAAAPLTRFGAIESLSGGSP